MADCCITPPSPGGMMFFGALFVLVWVFVRERDSDLSAIPPSVITLFVCERDSDLSAIPPSVITLPV
jgi:hypothetical protein